MDENDVRPAETKSGDSQKRRKLELLAPAGDESCLEAALEAGADAVYFGLTILNARRRAGNFTQDQLVGAVETVHARGARAYLTLNIDLTERELDLAARLLEVARSAGCDAVLVRDPALFALRAAYPELEFHFSTQTCMTNSADVAAAADLGASRVVLAREMDLAEINAASGMQVETEVFVQGALCFSVSGRCLMSSWVGGRSGNRGACTSPCRVPWTLDGQPAGTPLSMHDLSALERLEELENAGVTAVKIEGRMKKADWVQRAVSIFRRAMDGAATQDLADEIEYLGAYTGRRLTSSYLDGQRDGLTGTSGRPRTPAESISPRGGESLQRSDRDRVCYDLELIVAERGIQIHCAYAGVVEDWTIPKTVVRRKNKAMTIAQLLEWLSIEPMHGAELGRGVTNEEDFLMVPRAVNALVRRISKIVQRGQKKRVALSDVELPEAVGELLEKPARCLSNRTELGTPPERVRLGVDDAPAFLAEERPGGVIVEGLDERRFRQFRAVCGRVPLTVALPPVFFEEDIPPLQALLRECARANVVVEVNSWGGWRLAKQAGARFETGPGLPVLNSLCAKVLAKSGALGVTLSPEAGRRQLEEAAAHCPLPCSLVVFGRPALMISRVQPSQAYVDHVLADRRDTKVLSRKEGALWVLRPVTPFDLRTIQNSRLLVKRLVVDLVGSPKPVTEWRRAASQRKPPFHFNYDRGLV